MASPGRGHAGWNLPRRPPGTKVPSPDDEPDYAREPGHFGAAAVTGLTGALMVACPQGHIRIFADEGDGRGARPAHRGQRAGQTAAGIPFGYLARVTPSPRRPGTNAGRGYTLVPGAPRKTPPDMSPFGGRLARRVFLACVGRNAHRREEAHVPPSSPTRPTAAPRPPAPPRPSPADPALICAVRPSLFYLAKYR